MKHRSLVVLLVLLLLILHQSSTPSASAKPGTLYQTTWGGSNYDYGQAVTVDSSGNSYVVGYTWSFTPGTPSVFLLKYSYTGTLLMQRLWSDGADDYAYGVALDKSGNIYVTGWTDHSGGPSILILKFNPLGGLAWQKTYAGSSHPAYGYGIAADSTGNIYVTGYYASGSSSDQNVTLLKFDPTGNLIWQRSWGGANPDQGTSLALDPTGNVYVAGSTNSFGAGGADVFLLKFNSTGGLLSEVTWGGSSDDKAYGVAVDSSGTAYVTGGTQSVGLTSAAFLLKFSSTGALLIKKIYSLTGATVGYGIAVNSTTKEVWIAGSTIIGAYSKGLILRMSTTGTMISQTTWGGNGGSDAAYAIADDVSGNTIITGYVSENGPYSFTNATGSFSNSNLNTTTPAVAPLDPGFAIGFAAGSVSIPAGSTTYSGGPDVITTKFGSLAQVTYLTSIAGSGTIFFNGNAYQSGSSDSFTYGSYTANATAATGFIFTRWNVTGGLSVSNPYSQTIQVNVTGPGTLTAGFKVSIATIIIGITPVGNGTVTCNGQTFTAKQSSYQISYNSTLACTANPYSGIQFQQWSGLSTASSPSISIQVRGNGNLGASFTPTPKTPSITPQIILLMGIMVTSTLALSKRRAH